VKTVPARKQPQLKAPPKVARVPSKQFTGAVAALEAGIKLMYAEDYAKAVKAFNKVIADYAEEPEIQASAKARIQACEKKLQERARTVFRTADDHYNVAVALMNSGDVETAMTHLQSALKLAPKADHILYAMAAANALQGNRDQALSYLKQSIHHRAENRFQALQDNDFAVLAEEQAFKDLVAPPDK
jgi:tetratricopeptide (TPR) repeat protein